jgi:hypothetical protein
MTFINHDRLDNATLAGQAELERNDLAARLPRSNTFLGAELHWSGAFRPCQVRDLSEGGALLVVDSAPPAGTRALLVRGPHRLGAFIVWSDAKRCGLRFDHTVIVADLISGKGAGPTGPPVVEANHSVPTAAIADLCSRADRLSAAIEQSAGPNSSIHAECVALAEALQRIRVSPASA